MAQFGGYETVREVYQGGPGAVYVARADGNERFAVKAFQPPPWLADEERVELEAGLFLDAAGVQQTVAKGSVFWAPVHTSGRCEGGAWYATDLFDRSVEKLVLQRRELDAKELHRIIETAVNALVDLKKQFSRPHGNLKPTNVLISGRGESARIAVSDLLPGARIREGEDFANDLRGIGDLIHQLVLHKPMRTATAWPALASPEWQRLGKAGEHWLALCNHLLEPTGKLPQLEEVARAVGALKTLGQAAARETLLRSTASIRSVTSGNDVGLRSSGMGGDSWIEASEGGGTEAAGATAGGSRGRLVGIALAVVVIGGGGLAFMFMNSEGNKKSQPEPGKSIAAVPKDSGPEVPTAGTAPAPKAEPLDSEVAVAERERLETARKQKEEEEATKRAAAKRPAAEETARSVLALIGAGYGMGDETPNGQPVGRIFDAVASDPDFPRIVAASPIVADAQARLSGLRQIAESSNAGFLVPRASTGELAEAIAAWQELADPTQTIWPATGTELRQAGDILIRIKGLTVGAGARSSALAASASQQGLAIYNAAIRRIRFASEEDVSGLRAAMAAFGASDAGLDPRWRFNVAYQALRTDLAAFADAPEEEIKDRIRAFLDAANAMGEPVRSRAEVAPLLAELSALVAKPVTVAGSVANLGPGSKGWSIQPGEVKGTTTFIPVEGSDVAIEFAEITADGRSVMLSTTEVSIAVVRAVVERAQLTPQQFSELTKSGSSGWRGPRGWRVSNQRIEMPATREFSQASNWLARITALTNIQIYDPAVQSTVRPPTLQHPFNDVSPTGAATIAAELGCRLPTAAEWAAATALEPNAPANRRDHTWTLQQQHAATVAVGARQYISPDYGVFEPTGQRAASGLEAKAVTDEDDGALWFSPVSDGGGTLFHHLVGNTWEIVTSGSGYSVIGASALSAPEFEPAIAQPIATGTARTDLGFRLAFDYEKAPVPVAVASGADLTRAALGSLAKVSYLN